MPAAATQQPPNLGDRPGTNSPRKDRGALGIGHVALVLGVVALALGGSGLAIAVTHAGPAGSNGATGARGPAGPGAVVNSTSYQATEALTNGTCTVATGSTIGFETSGPGAVTLTVSMAFIVLHTNGDYLSYYVSLASSTSSCDVLGQPWVDGIVDVAEPSGEYTPLVSMTEVFPVAAAGMHTFDIQTNCSNYYGLDTASVNGLTETGVFYPS